MALNNTLETFTLRGTDYVNKFGVIEQLYSDSVTEIVLLIKFELGQVLFWCCAGLLEVSPQRHRSILLLSLSETQLYSLVTILLYGFNLGYNTRTSFDNSARNILTVGTENGCHSDFFS